MELPSIRSFTRTITFNGIPVILFTDEGGGEYPILGAMLQKRNDNEEMVWVPMAWTKAGLKFADTIYHNLNIVIPTERLAA